MRQNPTYQLTRATVAAHAGGNVVCLSAAAEGRRYRLHAERPGVETNDRRFRSDVIGPEGDADAMAGPETSFATIVRIDGPIEQRAGYYGECGGWTDGHDAIAERLCAALAEGDVLLVVDSPGGAVSGIQEAVRAVLEAKALYSRRIVAWADEDIASAGYWWACVTDEIYLPVGGAIGSVGTRSMHLSMAWALAEEGVEPTIFTWPGPGKAAFAPELPLSDVAKMRGARDVTIYGEAFAAAVSAARGLTVEQIAALDADMLIGQLAVDAGLADGVATFDDVLAYMANAAGANATTDAASSGTTARTSRTRADMAKEKDDDEGGEMTMPPGKDCARCGEATMANHKFCPSCGASMAAPPMQDPEEASEPMSPAGMPKPGMTNAHLAEMLDLRPGASLPTVKGRVAPLVSFEAAVFAMTGTNSHDRAIGAIKAMAIDAEAAGTLRATMKTERAEAEGRERIDLLEKLAGANLPGFARGDLFVDKVSADGTWQSKRPVAEYAEMRIGTLREFVAKRVANSGAPPKRDPWQPNERSAKASQESGTRGDVIEQAMHDPVVVKIYNRGDNRKSLREVAEAHVASMASIGGN